MPAYTEDQFNAAILAVENGMSRNKAAKEYKIPRSTLQGRLKGFRSTRQYHIDVQVLSETQEAMLAQWARIQLSLGFSLTHSQLRLAAQGVLKEAGKEKPLGKNWTTKFLSRNPSLRTLQGKWIETKRVQGVQPDNIKVPSISLPARGSLHTAGIPTRRASAKASAQTGGS